MINIAICDDEKVFLNQIHEILNREAQSIGENIKIDLFSSGEELKENIMKNGLKYQLVFLDILMHGLDGMTLGKYIKDIDESVEIFYISVSKDFVFDAYDLGAFNYITKPIDVFRLRNQFIRVIRNIRKKINNTYTFSKNGSIIKYKTDDILYFEVNNRIVTLHGKNEKIEFYEKIENIEKELKEKNFIRVHRGYLVNLEYIFKIEGADVTLTTDDKVPISRLKIRYVKDKFLKYVDSTII